jgi:GH24 family phage-related lysozyme (muramidase)
MVMNDYSFRQVRLQARWLTSCYAGPIMPTYFAELLAQLKVFEDCVPWMYLDSVGKVTVGVGLMLPDAAAACALGFALNGAAATAEQIGGDFARVAALAADKLPNFYRAESSPELPQELIDAKLSAVLLEFEGTVRARVSGYDSLPDGVKMALLDMAYNLGPAGLLKGYPRMLSAVQAGDWAQAAAECARGGIGAARNAWTAKQFLSATVAAIRGQAEIEGWRVERRLAAWFTRVGRWLGGLLRRRR